MAKQTKSKEELRQVGPKFARNNVLPQNFQIRRPSSPMADLLDAADELSAAIERQEPQIEEARPQNLKTKTTPVDFTPVKSTGVKITGVDYLPTVAPPNIAPGAGPSNLPSLSDFLDRVLPRFPPARQAIMLRLYRWNEEAAGEEMVVSTPKLAAQTNMDEKSCRNHLHALIAEGFLLRTADGEQIAKFGGSDRAQRGLLLKISEKALRDLIQ